MIKIYKYGEVDKNEILSRTKMPTGVEDIVAGIITDVKENGDKIPADHKPAIEQALQQLKDAHKAGDVAAIDAAIAALNTAWQTASQQMYQQAGPQPGADAGQQQANNQQTGGTDETIQDADFEEVK